MQCLHSMNIAQISCRKAITVTLVAARKYEILGAVQAKLQQWRSPSGTRRAVNKRPVTCKVVALNIQSIFGAKTREVVVSRLEIRVTKEAKYIIYRRPKCMLL